MVACGANGGRSVFFAHCEAVTARFAVFSPNVFDQLVGLWLCTGGIFHDSSYLGGPPFIFGGPFSQINKHFFAILRVLLCGLLGVGRGGVITYIRLAALSHFFSAG